MAQSASPPLPYTIKESHTQREVLYIYYIYTYTVFIYGHTPIWPGLDKKSIKKGSTFFDDVVLNKKLKHILIGTHEAGLKCIKTIDKYCIYI